MATRRTFLAGVAGVAATAGLAACGGGTSGTATQQSTGPATLRFAWWGNEVRNKMTNQVIADYMKANPGITITAEPGEWAGYWDKLATQVAGKDAPDIIQMDEQYIRDYSKRGALADLSKLPVDTSKFATGLVDTGTIDGKVTALCAGMNALSILANTKVFSDAGVAIPDDKTWTWETLRSTAAEFATNKPGLYGINGAFFGDSVARAWMFQHGKALFTETSLGFEPADMQSFFDMMMTYLQAKAIPTPAENAEDLNKPIAQNMFALGKLGMTLLWSNQVNAMQQAVGSAELKILRLPSLDGTAKGANLWYKSGQYQSISSTSKYQQQAAKFLDYYFNSMDAGKVLLAERGLPPNTDVLNGIQSLLGPADQRAAAYMKAIEPDLRKAPVPPPPGIATFQTILNRYIQDVQFGRLTSADAAKKLYDEAKAQIR